MAANAPTTPKRGTWRDWLQLPDDAPDQPLVTRDELLELLRMDGVDAKKSDLLFWQTAGVLPYPIKRWHRGATRSWYPAWFGGVVRQLRALQDEGYPLEEIGPQLRPYLRLLYAYNNPAPADPATREAWSNRPQDLAPQLRAIARGHEVITGTKIPRIEVRLFDEQGHPLTYSFDTNGL